MEASRGEASTTNTSNLESTAKSTAGSQPEIVNGESSFGFNDTRNLTGSTSAAGAAILRGLPPGFSNRAVAQLARSWDNGRRERTEGQPAPAASVQRVPSQLPTSGAALVTSPVAAQDTSIPYQGEALTPDVVAVKAILARKLPILGGSATSAWAWNYVNVDWAEKAARSVHGSKRFVDAVEAAVRSAVTDFDSDRKEYLRKFEETSKSVILAMLDNARDQILKEQERLGITKEVIRSPQGGTAMYGSSRPDAMLDAKSRAASLATLRATTDGFGRLAIDSRRAVQQAANGRSPSADPPVIDFRAPIKRLELVPGPGGIPSFVDAELVERQREAEKEWRKREADFSQASNEATAACPSLAPLLNGGTDVADRLQNFASQSNADSAQNMGEQFAEKLANIETVRPEVGGRFSVWKQPLIAPITHRQLGGGPGQQRLVQDHAKELAEKAEETKLLWGAIALGLGLLAAVPTGGSSLIAGVAFAAGATGAAMSAYQAFESFQDYTVQSAATNTSLDRAHQISADEPSLLWLAIDVAAAIADLGAAKAAFTTLKEAIVAARAAPLVEAIPKLTRAMRSAGVTPANQGKLFAEVLPHGGDIGKALHEIRQALQATAGNVIDAEQARLMLVVAEKAMEKGRVIVVPNTKQGAYEVLRFRLSGRPGIDVDLETNRILKKMFSQDESAQGLFYRDTGLIVLRGSMSAENAAAVLVHELTHLGQRELKILNSMGTYRSEFEAFKAQQQFLLMLPTDRVPADAAWLLKSTDAQIEQHVLTAYAKEGAIKPTNISNQAIADDIFNTLFAAGGAK